MMMLNDLSYDNDNSFSKINNSENNLSVYKRKELIQAESLNIENINKSLRIIEVQIVFLQIGEVDTINEKFQAIVKIKSKWYENEILSEYDPREDWNPKLFIENALYDKFQEEISYDLKVCDDKTLITETRISKGVFWERMELPDFPLDIQGYLILINYV
jgi:hypothetical protein